MPCSDSNRSGYSYSETYHKEYREAEKQRIYLEGILCAVINEVERSVSPKDFTQFIANAEKEGDVEIFNWINKHKREDFKRMEAVLATYSADELEVIKKVLKTQELLKEKPDAEAR